MKHYSDYELSRWNTFGIALKANEVVILEQDEDFIGFASQSGCYPGPFFILGGGSNVLFCADFPGTIVKIANRGMEVVSREKEGVLLRVSAGEAWETVIDFCLEHGFGGLENLTMIPGQAGSAAVQNIGAYGVEAGNVIEKVEVVDMESGSIAQIFAADCHFGYRSSIFKDEKYGKKLIRNVYFRLSTHPRVNTSYGVVKTSLSAQHIAHPEIRDVVEIIRRIREEKLPDPVKLGNAGSFFKNPVVSGARYASLQVQFPGIPGYPLADGAVKLAAGWLIEAAGWKGYRAGDAGVYPLQALVLVNYGNATGSDILHLSEQIRASIQHKFGVMLEREVLVLP